MDPYSHPGNLDQDTPDGILVQRSIGGDRKAFEDLAERYRPLLEGYVSRWCSDPQLVSDVMQGVLLQLYLSLPSLHIDRSLKAWLLQVAHNCCMNEYRRKQPLLFSQLASASGEEDLDVLATMPDPDLSPEELVEQQELQTSLVQAIRALPVKQRQVVWLRYADQLSFTDIGRQLNMPEATAKTNFARAKPVLRRLLTEGVFRASP
jgi:RNA polymerase sigma-70 factor (ECF subfamily)